MTYETMQLIPLSSAYLCQDCSAIGNNPIQCPGCASSALMGLAGVLNRESKRELAPSCLQFCAKAA